MELKDLKSLLKVLRDNGVTSYVSPELQLTLSEDFSGKPISPKKSADAEEPDMDSEWERLSDEEKLLWSAGE